MPRYTLIIPHYNVPKLLNRLLLTVPRRDDMQVIVIDDCSTRDLDELETVKSRYPWIEWCSTDTNGGGGKARNVGLMQAKGDYLLFADADDYFLPTFNDLLDEYKDRQFDILYFSALYHYEKRKGLYSEIYFDCIKKYKKTKNDKDIKFKLWQVWCKIINRSIVEKYNIRFDETYSANDVTFSTLLDYHAKDIYVTSEICYIYNYISDSSCHGLSCKKELGRLKVEINRHFFLKSKNLQDRRNYLNAWNYILDSNDKTYIQKANELISDYKISQFHIFIFRGLRVIKKIILWDRFDDSIKLRIRQLFRVE